MRSFIIFLITLITFPLWYMIRKKEEKKKIPEMPESPVSLFNTTEKVTVTATCNKFYSPEGIIEIPVGVYDSIRHIRYTLSQNYPNLETEYVVRALQIYLDNLRNVCKLEVKED